MDTSKLVSAEEIKDSETKKRVRKFVVELSEEIDGLLENVIVPFYRTTSASHAVRLLIEDAAKSINSEGNKIVLDRREL